MGKRTPKEPNATAETFLRALHWIPDDHLRIAADYFLHWNEKILASWRPNLPPPEEENPERTVKLGEAAAAWIACAALWRLGEDPQMLLCNALISTTLDGALKRSPQGRYPDLAEGARKLEAWGVVLCLRRAASAVARRSPASAIEVAQRERARQWQAWRIEANGWFGQWPEESASAWLLDAPPRERGRSEERRTWKAWREALGRIQAGGVVDGAMARQIRPDLADVLSSGRLEADAYEAKRRNERLRREVRKESVRVLGPCLVRGNVVHFSEVISPESSRTLRVDSQANDESKGRANDDRDPRIPRAHVEHRPLPGHELEVHPDGPTAARARRGPALSEERTKGAVRPSRRPEVDRRPEACVDQRPRPRRGEGGPQCRKLRPP